MTTNHGIADIYGSSSEETEKSATKANSLMDQLTALEDQKLAKNAISMEEIDAMIQKIAVEESSVVRDILTKRFSKISGVKQSEINATVTKTRREVARKISSAQVSNWWDDLGFGIPEPYSFGASGVIVRGQKADEKITTRPFWVNALVTNLSESTEEVELAWRSDYGQASLILPRSKIFQPKEFLHIADQGAPLLPSKVMQAADYVVNFIAENEVQLEQDKKFLSRKPGWIRLPDGELEFSAYSKRVIFAVAGEKAAEQHLTSKGTLDGWLGVRQYVEKSPMLAFLMAASLTAPLLEILQCSGFILDQYGGSGTGKTTSQCVSASLFGRPGGQNGAGLVTPWNATPTFVETMLGFFSHLPLFCMDSHELKDEPLEKVAFMVANGAGKGRATKELGTKARGEWRSVLLSDGEMSMYERLDTPGAKARVISLRGAAAGKLEKQDIGPLNEIIHGNYGLVAPLYIAKVQELASELPALFKTTKAQLASRATSNTEGRISVYFAAIMVAIHVMSKIEKMEWFASVAAVALDEAWNLAITDNREESSVERALRAVGDWVSQNQQMFVTSAAARFPAGSACYGRIDDKKSVMINSTKLDEYLKDKGFKSPKMLFEALREAGVIRATQSNNKISALVQGKPMHTYQFLWSALYPSDSATETVELEAEASVKVVAMVPRGAETITGRIQSIREVVRGDTLMMTEIVLADQGLFYITEQYKQLLEKLSTSCIGTDNGDEVTLHHVVLDSSGRRQVCGIDLKKTVTGSVSPTQEAVQGKLQVRS